MPAACEIPMPWSQLTHLVLTGREDSHHISLHILAQSPGLETVSIEASAWCTPPPPRAKMLALNHLRSLTLKFLASGATPSQNPLTPFLDRIDAPALDALCLASYPEVMPWAEAHFTAFQRRSPSITQLELAWAGPSPNDFHAVLRHAPSLTRLKLEHCPSLLDDTLLNALSYKHDAEYLVPSLRELVIHRMTGSGFTPDVLAGMIASRWWTDAELAVRSAPPAVARWTLVELKRLGASGPDLSLDPNFVGRIEELRRQGLHLVSAF
ncbi:hypothetical protein DFH06DRAFT_1211792 [Mycena polygramma]|nr:hypothetical protein DFH06DRAFT_1211792 [Mycena polygramma]